MTGVSERLDAIEAKWKRPLYATPVGTPNDVAYLLDLARKQQTAIDAVRAVEPIKHGTDHDARFANGYNAAIAGIRAAITGEGGA